jgi:hypothetical protein
MTPGVEQIPFFARSLLLFGHGCREMAQVFEQARGFLPYTALTAGEIEPETQYDCLVLVEWPSSDEFRAVTRHVAPQGWLLAPWPEEDAQEAAVRAVEQAGLVVYDVRHAKREASWAIAVPPDYDPMAHAQDWRGRGRPDLSFEILAAIPFRLRNDPETFVLVEIEKQYSALEADGLEQGTRRLERFWQSQMSLYDVVHVLPDAEPAFRCQAEFWRRIGDPGYGAGLLRSMEALGSTSVAQQRAALDAEHTQQPEREPLLEFSERPTRRILFLMNSTRPHYGLDTLFDGLCQLLGPDNVVDFPHKPTLHGSREGLAANQWERYPCLFEWPGTPYELEQILADLRAGRFDTVLYGDLEHDLPREATRQISLAAGGTPFFVVDQQDDPLHNLPRVLDFLGRNSVDGYFKRETLRSVDYGPRAWPLPFSWPDSRLVQPRPFAEGGLPSPPSKADQGGCRTPDIFWAGHRRFGLRRLYLEHLERLVGRSFEAGYEPDAYATALDTVLLGLCLGGVGFDTIRYWEIPARGCALFAERPPIVIPNNFEDNKSAIFFNDLSTFQEKLQYYLAHPGEAEAIGRRGQEHLRAHHTSSRRAAQLLARMHQ